MTGAVVLNSVLGKISEMMVDVVKDEVAMILGVPKEMEKLKGTLEMISRVLEDAKRKRLTDKVVEKWLHDLKDVMYDADDIFDLWKIKIDKEPTAAAASPATILTVGGCLCLRVVKNLPALHDIYLFDDLKFNSIPNWLAQGEDSAKPSRVLKIFKCTMDLIKKVCLMEEGEEWPKIRHISNVKIYAEDGDSYAIYAKTPFSFTANINDDSSTDTSSD